MDICALHRQGLSNRAITRRLGLDRRTVKKYVEQPQSPAYSSRASVSKLAPYTGLIDAWLAKGSYTATWIHDRLKRQGYDGGYDTVRRYVRRVKDRAAKLAYVRFETEPGFQAQVDFADFKIRLEDGAEQTV